jgi:hypothetical protein
MLVKLESAPLARSFASPKICASAKAFFDQLPVTM